MTKPCNKKLIKKIFNIIEKNLPEKYTCEFVRKNTDRYILIWTNLKNISENHSSTFQYYIHISGNYINLGVTFPFKKYLGSYKTKGEHNVNYQKNNKCNLEHLINLWFRLENKLLNNKKILTELEHT